MLEYDRIDISGGADVNKTHLSKEWFGFKYEPYLYNGCHHLMQKAMQLLFMLKEVLTQFIFGT